MMSRRKVAAAVAASAALLLAGCQWLLPDRPGPGVQPGSTFEAASPLPTLPIATPSEVPRLSPSIEIPPPID